MKTFRSRLALTALDIVFGTAVVACAWVALEQPAFAYVDPSVMTYTIQALAGVAVALSAVLGVVWRRARRWLYHVLKIDGNAGKIVEPVVTDANGNAKGIANAATIAMSNAGAAALNTAPRKHGAHFAENVAASKTKSAQSNASSTNFAQSGNLLAQADQQASDERAKQGIKMPVNLGFGARFILALLAAFTFCFSQFVAAPLEIIATNAAAFTFSFTSVWVPLAIFGVISTIVLTLIMSAFRGRGFDFVFALIIGLSVATLIQALLFNSDLPSANGTKIVLSVYKTATVTSTAMWVVVMACILVAGIKSSTTFKGISVIVCLVLTLTSGISMTSALLDNAAQFDVPKTTKEGLFTVSDKKNVIVFILDFFDTTTLDSMLEEYPDALDGFDGFTNFHNATSQTIPTAYGVPYLTTGNWFDTDDTESTLTTSERVQQMFSEHNLLDDANEQGYTVGVYSDSLYEGYSTEDAPLVSETINVHETNELKVNSGFEIVSMLVKISAFRNAPWLLKPTFLYYTGDINNAIVASEGNSDEDTPYLLDDPEFYSELCEKGLTTMSEGNGAYRVIHLTGSHKPYTMDENAQDVTDNLAVTDPTAARNRQAAGSLKIVREYIDQLKEMGLYDDATIIVTSDHGNYVWRVLPETTATPILMVKPSGAGSDSGAIQTSEVPTGHMDLPATIREAMGIEVDEPTVFEVTDGERKRYFYWMEENTVNTNGNQEVGWHEIEIDGDALDFNNWTATGRFYANGENWLEKYEEGKLVTTNPNGTSPKIASN